MIKVIERILIIYYLGKDGLGMCDNYRKKNSNKENSQKNDKITRDELLNKSLREAMNKNDKALKRLSQT